MIIPILTYHAISREKVSNNYIIQESNFAKHLEFISSNNFNCVSLEEYYSSLQDSTFNLPEKSIMVTFDDGHESDFRMALPILRKHKITANFFITTDWIDKPGYMTQNQLKTLKDEGMSVHSHAKSHQLLDEIVDNERIFRELKESKEILENVLDDTVSFISFPGGRYNRDVIACAKEINYLAVFCSAPFYFTKVNGIYLVGRNMVKSSLGLNEILNILKMNSWQVTKHRGNYLAKLIIKKVLGKNFYYSLWEKYNKKFIV